MKFITLHSYPDGGEVDIAVSSIIRFRVQEEKTHLDISNGIQIVTETIEEVRVLLKEV